MKIVSAYPAVLLTILLLLAPTQALAWKHGTNTGPPPATLNTNFGELTPASYGCATLPIGTTSVSGAHSADFQVIASCLSKTTAGFTNFPTDCASGCTLTTNLSQTLNISDAGATVYNLASQTEWDGTSNGAYGAGKGIALQATTSVASFKSKTLQLRSGLQITADMLNTSASPLFRVNYGIGTPLTITSDDLGTIEANAVTYGGGNTCPVDTNGDLVAGCKIGALLGSLAGFKDGVFLNFQNVTFRGLQSQILPNPNINNFYEGGSATFPVSHITWDWDLIAGTPFSQLTGAPLVDNTSTFQNGISCMNGNYGLASQWLNGLNAQTFTGSDNMTHQCTGYTAGPSATPAIGYGIDVTGDLVDNNNNTVTNTTFVYREAAFYLSDAGAAVANDNMIDVYFNTGIHFIYSGAATSAPVIHDNIVMRGFATPGSYGAYNGGAGNACGVQALSTCTAHPDFYHTDPIYVLGICQSLFFCGAHAHITTSGTSMTIQSTDEAYCTAPLRTGVTGCYGSGPVHTLQYLFSGNPATEGGTYLGTNIAATSGNNCPTVGGVCTLSNSSLNYTTSTSVFVDEMNAGYPLDEQRNVLLLGNAPMDFNPILNIHTSVGATFSSPTATYTSFSGFGMQITELCNVAVGAGETLTTGDVQGPSYFENNTNVGINAPATGGVVMVEGDSQLIGTNNKTGRNVSEFYTYTGLAGGGGGSISNQAADVTVSPTTTSGAAYASMFAETAPSGGVPFRATGYITNGLLTITVFPDLAFTYVAGSGLYPVNTGWTVTVPGGTNTTIASLSGGTGTGGIGTYTTTGPSQTVGSSGSPIMLLITDPWDPVTVDDVFDMYAPKSGGALDKAVSGQAFNGGALQSTSAVGVDACTLKPGPGGGGTTNFTP